MQQYIYSNKSNLWAGIDIFFCTERKSVFSQKVVFVLCFLRIMIDNGLKALTVHFIKIIDFCLVRLIKPVFPIIYLICMYNLC